MKTDSEKLKSCTKKMKQLKRECNAKDYLIDARGRRIKELERDIRVMNGAEIMFGNVIGVIIKRQGEEEVTINKNSIENFMKHYDVRVKNNEGLFLFTIIKKEQAKDNDDSSVANKNQ